LTARAHPNSLAFRYRSACKLLTLANYKTPKGEAQDYLTGILYLAPHVSGGGATLCPHSTEACRTMCLSGSGLSGLPRQMAAKVRRTQFFNRNRGTFLRVLADDVARLREIAAKHGVTPVLRLNGVSDVLWERQEWDWDGLGLQRYDYTKVPLHLRRASQDYHLTYSVGGPEDMERAVGYLAAGHSVAAVVPADIKDDLLSRANHRWPLVDGDAHDLRFLDPPGSVVLLKPKGRILTELVRPNILGELSAAMKRAA